MFQSIKEIREWTKTIIKGSVSVDSDLRETCRSSLGEKYSHGKEGLTGQNKAQIKHSWRISKLEGSPEKVKWNAAETGKDIEGSAKRYGG